MKQGGGDRFLACLRESESASFGLCCGNVLGLCQPQQCGALLRHAKLRANLEFEKSDSLHSHRASSFSAWLFFSILLAFLASR